MSRVERTVPSQIVHVFMCDGCGCEVKYLPEGWLLLVLHQGQGMEQRTIQKWDFCSEACAGWLLPGKGEMSPIRYACAGCDRSWPTADERDGHIACVCPDRAGKEARGGG